MRSLRHPSAPTPGYVELPLAAAGSVISSAWFRRPEGERFVVLPDGQTDLFFRRTRDGWRGFVVGPMPVAMEPPPTRELLVGVRLRPGAARTLVGVPIAALAGQMLPLAELGLSNLLDHAALDAATTGTGALRAFALAVASTSPRRAPVDPRVLEAVAQLEQGAPSVHAVARALRLTERHLLRLFRDDVGIPPRRIGALGRLRRAMSLRQATLTPWARVAAEAGYADESHLARAARRLTGLSPTSLVSAMSDSSNAGHVRVPIPSTP